MSVETFDAERWLIELTLYGGYATDVTPERVIASAMGDIRRIKPHVEIRQAVGDRACGLQVASAANASGSKNLAGRNSRVVAEGCWRAGPTWLRISSELRNRRVPGKRPAGGGWPVQYPGG